MSAGNGSSVPCWETSDLGSAAFVHMQGLKIRGVRKTGNKFIFLFDDPDERGKQLSVDYLNSDCRKFDSAVRSLKKLCYDGNTSSRNPRTKVQGRTLQ